jgi:hypothetical protein
MLERRKLLSKYDLLFRRHKTLYIYNLQYKISQQYHVSWVNELLLSLLLS